MLWTRRAAILARKGFTGGTSGPTVSIGGAKSRKRGSAEGAGVGYLREVVDGRSGSQRLVWTDSSGRRGGEGSPRMSARARET